MKYQYRNHFLECGETFYIRGDRHNDINGSADAGQEQEAADNIQ
jgi:hypothetical protein